ncbi:hypothetical protein V8G54_001517 [Vigna mungo]|uniref:Uncharacterized protein n=1 Tax=Vigna mungo TaxID=3915 RepID=A0AAQ3PAJ7_VIGMU
MLLCPPRCLNPSLGPLRNFPSHLHLPGEVVHAQAQLALPQPVGGCRHHRCRQLRLRLCLPRKVLPLVQQQNVEAPLGPLHRKEARRHHALSHCLAVQHFHGGPRMRTLPISALAPFQNVTHLDLDDDDTYQNDNDGSESFVKSESINCIFDERPMRMRSDEKGFLRERSEEERDKDDDRNDNV